MAASESRELKRPQSNSSSTTGTGMQRRDQQMQMSPTNPDEGQPAPTGPHKRSAKLYLLEWSITAIQHIMDNDAFNEECLKVHNELRQLHGCPPLQLHDDLVEYAQKWAEYIAVTGLMDHSPESLESIGENISMMFCTDIAQFSGTEASDEWYSQVQNYNFDDENQLGCGHFSQLVWKDTVHVGFGRAMCEDGRVFVVGQYMPPGNVMNRWRENVPRPLNGHIFKRRMSASSATSEGSLSTSRMKSLNDSIVSLKKSSASFGAGDDSNNHQHDSAQDRLVGRSTKSRVLGNGSVSNTVTETFETPEGDRYVINTEFDEILKNGDSNHDVEDGHFKVKDASRQQCARKKIKPKRDDSVSSSSDSESERRRKHKKLLEQPIVELEDLRAQLLEQHNHYRQMHYVQPLLPSRDLDEMAQAWAEHLRDKRRYKEKCPWQFKSQPVGENTLVKLHYGMQLTGLDLTNMWYQEGCDFPFQTEDPGVKLRKCAHFSQMLWNASEEVGVGRAVDSDGHTWIVCLYSPQGNVRHHFDENVFPAAEN